jgi:transglutaminase-like putative cysteine protease
VTLLVEATTSRSLLLEQRIRYEYSAPVERLRQRLIVVPPAVHGGQRRGDWSLTVAGVDAAVRTRTDRFGNMVVDIGARRVERWIQFDVSAAVERVAARDPHRTALDRRFLRHTPLTTADARIRDLVSPGAMPADICARANRSLTYELGITEVRTSAAEAIRHGRGVCQDFAHIMISGLRGLGLPAAYVSGYLRTVQAPNEDRLAGADAMHAWVLVWCGAEPGWCGLDPTNGIFAGDDHVVLAIGRDYADVAPIDGVIIASGGQRLEVSVSVTPVG